MQSFNWECVKQRYVKRKVCYVSDGPETYAQMLIKTSVRQAPANPETKNFI